MVKSGSLAKFEFDGFNLNLFNKIIFGLIILFVLLIIYFSFYNVEKCESFECFKKSMEDCKKIYYVNEEPEASWGYQIKGNSDGSCNIEVKLLLAKKGELGIDELVGYEMNCLYPKGVGTYPEKDLSECHGRLKEELQQIIIDKLHVYIIENLGKIDEELNSV